MDAVTATYLKMRAGPPAPKLGVRMGFLTESASEQFLTEYNKLREAKLIVPSAMVPSAVGGQMLCEAVEAPEDQDQVDEDAMSMIAAQFLHENFDEVSDSTFHLIAALPGVFAELAREWDMPLAEVTTMLLDPEPGMAEVAEAVLDDIIEDLEAHFAQEVEGDDGPEMALHFQDKKLKTSVRDMLKSGYVPGSEGDRLFAALHRVEVHDDPAGNGDDVFRGSNIRHATPLLDRSIARPAVMAESRTPWGIKPLSGLRMRSAI
jgi:hypothetical protein